MLQPCTMAGGAPHHPTTSPPDHPQTTALGACVCSALCCVCCMLLEKVINGLGRVCVARHAHSHHWTVGGVRWHHTNSSRGCQTTSTVVCACVTVERSTHTANSLIINQHTPARAYSLWSASRADLGATNHLSCRAHELFCCLFPCPLVDTAGWCLRRQPMWLRGVQ